MEKEILIDPEIPSLSGLVLSGGRSTRMGTDKSLIKYCGKPIYKFATELLNQLGLNAFVSCRKDQTDFFDQSTLIIDAYQANGPITGILSAFQKYPEVAWLVIPSDTPFLTTDFLRKNLLKNRDPAKDATLLKIKDQSFIQTLVGIYEPSSRHILRQKFEAGVFSLQQIVKNLSIQLIEIEDLQNNLANFNYPEDWDKMQLPGN